MPKDPEVEAWFARSDHPLLDVMLDVHRAIHATNGRVTGSMKERG